MRMTTLSFHTKSALEGRANRLSTTDALPGISRQILNFIIRALSGAVNLSGYILWVSLISWMFWAGFFPGSTKPAPFIFGLTEETGQHCPFPSLACVLPHPLQNRVPRVQVLLPLPKSQVSLLRYLTFSLVCGRIWQRGAPAGPPAVRVVGACSPVGCVQAPVSAPASVGAGRSPLGSSTPAGSRDQVLLPLPKKSGIASAVPGFFVSVR